MSRIHAAVPIHIILLILLAFGISSATLISACGTTESEKEEDPADALFKGISVAQTDNPEIPIVVAHTNGDWMAILADPNAEKINGVVYTMSNGSSFTVYLDNQGRPKYAYVTGYAFVYENYRENLVDIAVIGQDGNIQLIRDIAYDGDFLSQSFDKSLLDISNITNANKWAQLHSFLKVAATAATVAACGAAVATGVGAIAVAVPCGAAIANIISNYIVSDNALIEGSFLGFGVAAAGIGCATFEPFSCIAVATEIAAAVSGVASTKISEREVEIAGATGALRFGGVWTRRDISDAWFVINKDEAYDVFYISSRNCYSITAGEFVRVDGNVFTYRVLPDNYTIRLRYVLINPIILTATRLDDNFSVTMDRSTRPEQSFTPECRAKTVLPKSFSDDFNESLLLKH